MSKELKFLHGKEKDVILEIVSGELDVPACECSSFEKLEPNTSEGAGEKHIPVIEINGSRVTVKVGSIFHPMTEEHSIGWIQLHTNCGRSYRAYLKPTDEPTAAFTLEEGDSVHCAYAYCNLHGFWMSEA